MSAVSRRSRPTSQYGPLSPAAGERIRVRGQTLHRPMNFPHFSSTLPRCGREIVAQFGWHALSHRRVWKCPCKSAAADALSHGWLVLESMEPVAQALVAWVMRLPLISDEFKSHRPQGPRLQFAQDDELASPTPLAGRATRDSFKLPHDRERGSSVADAAHVKKSRVEPG
jgi:hypothetical protein